ncbi:GAF and ANTAR domain-containing protein [Arthrobacter burdickii]|uniref:GAF and ANTAR domain-containing protein n=1 Tax=Arthrobacter burdickii TaxID=3035920 RepID=A0ABT8JWH5_9MICC|nr:GAF and ANTAR domain-containing protein [Arthrobacter burdickii]MDN4609528.1 GAF and ANTAR domain-containing protein [Arthrobacter burdickii]
MHTPDNNLPDTSELFPALDAGPELDAGPGVGDRLHEAVTESANVIEFLDDLTAIAVDVLSAPDREVFCGVTLLRPKRAGTVASSSERAQQMDEIQYRFDDGPCLTAARQEHEVYVPDVEGLPADSKYRQAMEAQGVRSVLAVPIILPEDTYSALNLYSNQQGAFGIPARKYVHRFAAEAAKSLSIASRLASLVDAGIDLRAAMANRTTIDTAIGIVMAQNRCSQDEALAILMSAASARNIKLRDLAHDLITSIATDPPPTA